MTINIKLSTASIDHAISRLMDVEENILFGVNEFVDIMTNDAAEVATLAYGGMATATASVDDNEGTIIATGEAVGIAEFGAGDATMDVQFENNPDFPVYPGSYSESEYGTGQYARTRAQGQGYWFFGGHMYTEIPPRAGLLTAKEYVIENASIIAQEVIKP